MKLNRNQISHMQQSAWKLEEAIALLKKAGFSNGDMSVRKMQAALDEINYELNNYELERVNG